ncbi:MAG: ASKHA domain-containing protein [Candidatus Eisenbacteria bacterium]
MAGLEKQSVRVVIMPDSREVWVVSGSTIKEALFAASIPVSMPCGGHGRCGKCVVRVSGKVSEPDDAEIAKLPRGIKDARLACVARLEGDAEITVPATSRVSIEKIVSRGRTSRIYRFCPGIIKVFLGKQDPRRMKTLREDYGIGIEDIAINMMDAGLMDEDLRVDHEWRLGLHRNVTLVAAKGEIVGFEAGDTSSECYGLAVDLGTNTVVCSLVDLNSGRQLGITSTVNPQVMHGDDVISRIRFSKTSGGLEMLRSEVVNLINGLAGELARKLGVPRKRIYVCSVVGNTAMQHILVGVSLADLGRAPYRARLTSSVETMASRSGIGAHHTCRLLMPPPIGGFVGGDLVALIISQALHRTKSSVMAIDLGTNGEIVIAAGGKMAACSTAAGPAFEGERISCGVRAIGGAVEDVKITKDKIELKTIGNSRPIGLCGSGLIAAIAELLRKGVIEPNGRIKTRGEIKHKWLAKRVVQGKRGREFTFSSRPLIRLRQGDIREVQLGKAAICAGATVLSSVAGIDLEDVKTVLIAGGFGSSLRASSIRRLGLLPRDLEGDIKVIGNSAIEGAKIFLTSCDAREEAERAVEETEHVELFSRPEFKEEFYSSMGFPTAKLRK